MGLIPLMEDGLYIDLAGKIESRRGLEIPVYVVGSYESTDEVLDNIDELKKQQRLVGLFLIRKNKSGNGLWTKKLGACSQVFLSLKGVQMKKYYTIVGIVSIILVAIYLSLVRKNQILNCI